jgi:hypothetical protein
VAGRVPKNSLTMAAEPRRVMMSLDTVLDAISDLLLLPRYPTSGSGASSPPALGEVKRNGSEWQAATASAAAAVRCDMGMRDSEVVLLRSVSNGSTGASTSALKVGRTGASNGRVWVATHSGLRMARWTIHFFLI